MRGERYALRAGEYLVSRACRRLPARIREERYQEWLAELPVILHDRGAGPASLRVVRMLAFAADTLRGTTLAPGAYSGLTGGLTWAEPPRPSAGSPPACCCSAPCSVPCWPCWRTKASSSIN